ncbi:MAG: UbiA family prenyltransferase [Candidatus Thermoplasmatota archaeon]|nr:UbiA family prenyltransferase [Candidatus Thermoplasmatota archaeon]
MSLPAQKTIPLSVKLYAHFETMRPYTVIWCGLVSLVGSCIAFGDLPPFRIAFLVFIIPMLGWTAGLYLSDYLDRKLDAIEKPHRPIPSGRILPNEALIIGGLFAILGLVLSFLLNVNNIILVFIVALLVLLYARYTKSRGFLGNLTRGLVTVTAYFYGAVGAGIDITNIPVQLGVLSLVFFIHDTASNLVGSIRDVEGDRKGGYQTVPVRWGINISVIIAGRGCFLISQEIFRDYP